MASLRLQRELKKNEKAIAAPPTTPAVKPKAPKTLKPLLVNDGITPDKLDFWIKTGVNVLLVGRHGVGKTSIVKDAFERNNLKWKYFSASTMDPWVDFIGVPKERHDENGMPYLDIVRPKEFATGDIEGLVFDEYNRAPKQVRNAVMELIQFGSINGKKFNKLRVVWAMINPSDDEQGSYDVDELDPAQLDRFQVQLELPYKPDWSYFSTKYGSELAEVAFEWWNELPHKVRFDVSPRRLDYAIDYYRKGGNLREILNQKSNPVKLERALGEASIRHQVEQIFENNDKEKAQKFLKNENNYSSAIVFIQRHRPYLEFFLPYIHEEKLVNLMRDNEQVCEIVCDNKDRVLAFGKAVQSVVESRLDSALISRIQELLK